MSDPILGDGYASTGPPPDLANTNPDLFNYLFMIHTQMFGLVRGTLNQRNIVDDVIGVKDHNLLRNVTAYQHHGSETHGELLQSEDQTDNVEVAAFVTSNPAPEPSGTSIIIESSDALDSQTGNATSVVASSVTIEQLFTFLSERTGIITLVNETKADVNVLIDSFNASTGSSSTVIQLANEMREDVNNAVTKINELVSSLNELRAKLRTAHVLKSEAPIPPASQPENVVLPTITGNPKVGSVLTVSTGSWTNSPKSYEYVWQRCSGTSCTNIPGATSSSYLLTLSEQGLTVQTIVTARNDSGFGYVSTLQTSLIAPPDPPIGSIPVNSSVPTISGIAQEDVSLLGTVGTWTESPTSYSVKWYQCDVFGVIVMAIIGSTTLNYTPVLADVGTTLRVGVTATNSFGSSIEAVSDQTAVVLAKITPPLVPTIIVAPLIWGTFQEGSQLYVYRGSWTNSPSSYSYQWRRCNSSGSSCVAITGATIGSYTLTSSDVGETLRVTVIASNSAGDSLPSTSLPTDVIDPAPAPPIPSNTALPSIIGSPQEDVSISTSLGSWSNSPTSYAIQWYKCDVSGQIINAIIGATTLNYTPVTSDVGGTLRTGVIASNGSGSSVESVSVQSSIVISKPPPPPSIPVNTALPVLSGTAKEGEPMTSSTGSWTESPSSYSFQWRRCDSGGASCADLTGATNATYTPVTADVGNTLRCVVIATNAVGPSLPATSSESAVIQSTTVLQAPVNVTLPTITGVPQVNQTLTASQGTWQNAVSYAYQWRRCDSLGASCVNIGGSTLVSGTYTKTSFTYSCTVADGTTQTLTAHLYKPDGITTPRPGIIAGRGAANRTDSNPVVSVEPLIVKMASDGYVVIASDYWESLYAISEVTPLVDWLLAQTYVDSSNLFYFGTSWGGREGMEFVMSTGKLRAFVCMAPAVLISEAQAGQTAAQLDADYKALYPDSAALAIKNITTPVLLIHGEADTTVPPIVSEGIRLALVDYGKIVQRITYPGVPHAIIGTAVDTVYPDVKAWFLQYMNQGATNPTYVPTTTDIGSTLRINVTASNTVGSTTAISSATSVVTDVPAPTTKPKGIFTLDTVVNQPYVDGVLIRKIGWSTIETAPGVFNWSGIDNVLNQAKAAGQKATLCIFTDKNQPSWLFTNGVASYNDAGATKAIPWDTKFLGYLKQLIAAYGAKYGSDASVTMINAMGPSGSTNLGTTAPGYTSALFVDAWDQIMDAYAAAFPNTFLAIPVRFTNDTTNTMSIRNYCTSTYNQTWAHFGTFGDMLTGLAPATSGFGQVYLYSSGTKGWAAFQACGIWSNQATFSQCNWLGGTGNDTPNDGFLHLTNDLKATYAEIYGTDLNNSIYTATFNTWHPIVNQ